MKKLFVMTLAVAAMVGCSKVDTLESGQQAEINFVNHIDKTTRTLLDNSNLANFCVWGTEATNPIFAGDVVEKSGSDWTYTGARYWHTGNPYTFAAIAPSAHTLTGLTLTAGLPTSATFTLTDAEATQVDLLYCRATDIPAIADGYNTPVAFTFDHMLSQVNFTVENEYNQSGDYTVVVENLQITGSATADVALAAVPTWSSHSSADLVLDFAVATVDENSSEISSPLLVIPGIANTITGTVKTLYGTGVVETKAINFTTPVLEPDHKYNFVITVTPGNQIKFTAEVDDWTNGGDTDVVF